MPISPNSNISRRMSLRNTPVWSISRTWGPMRSRANLRTIARNMFSSSGKTVSGSGTVLASARVDIALILVYTCTIPDFFTSWRL